VRAERLASLRRRAAPLALSSLPMLGALLGAFLDEWRALGFTTWRSVCRAADLDLSSLVSFTLQLLPQAVIGLLLGSSVLLALAMGRRNQAHAARDCLAAHAACALTLPVALLICASALPWPLMLAADLVLTGAVALLLMRLLRPASRVALAGSIAPVVHP
jgi:hypothetical protein